jgi:predicted HAD superfamily Cof-like phosphohydrolase
LRLRLIAEEFEELIRACLDVSDEGTEFLQRSLRRLVDFEPVNVLLPEAVDALADIEYILLGTALEFGTDMGPIMGAVHAANMRKEGGPTRSDSKILKPPGWVPPDIEGALRAQGWEP